MAAPDEPINVDIENTTQERAQKAGESSGERDFEDLTLAELAGVFLRAPRTTLRALVNIADTPLNFPRAEAFLPETPQKQHQAHERGTLARDIRPFVPLGLYVVAFLLAFWGSVILVSAETRQEAAQLRTGAPFLLAGFLVWLGAEIYRSRTDLRAWWRRDGREQFSSGVDDAAVPVDSADGVLGSLRLIPAFGAGIFAVIAWLNTGGNQFTTLGFWSWLASIALIVLAVAPAEWSLSNLLRGVQARLASVRFRGNWTLLALILIVLVGAYFRLHNLEAVPPEMTSDHIEKLRDSHRVAQGDRDIFFTNNGGREPFQMYAMALFSQLPGLGIDFTSLKLLTIIEGLVTLPVLWWMGREVIGERDPTLGDVVGLTLVALVAVSYWHVTLTRLALRIVLTPLVAALLVIFLSRGMRYNRRGDFVLAGLVLGFGLYTYQAVRMMPLVVLAGVGMAFLANFRRSGMRLRYIVNLSVLVLISLVIFVPMLRFSVDFPQHFWMRTAGRMLGDDVIQETDAAGNLVQRKATWDERLEALRENLSTLANNVRNALLMYNWKGDVAWINGVPNHPVMDSFTGALLIVGLSAWLALIVHRRDPVLVLIPIMVFIMLLPSALAIAAPLENPSATRASGSLPPIYLIAALPLAVIGLSARRLVAGWRGTAMAGVMVGSVLLGAYFINIDLYFDRYLASYQQSWRSHSAPGAVLRGFSMSDGSYGNAFLLHHPHWLDHRIVGMEAGIIDWPNAVVALESTPDALADAWLCSDLEYHLDPNRDLLFFYSVDDEAAEEQLQGWFPNGRSGLMEQPIPRDNFKIYRAPALGEDGLREFLEQYAVNPRCM